MKSEIEIDLSVLPEQRQNEEVIKWWFELESLDSDISFVTSEPERDNSNWLW